MQHSLKYQINLTDGSFSRVMSAAQGQTRTLDKLVRNIAGGLGAAFAGDRLISYGNKSVETSAKVQGLHNAINFASKSEKEGAANLKYLDELTTRHGSNLMAATQGYKTFLGSMQGVPYSMNQIRKMYEQVDVANTVMNLSAEDSQGVYLALGQIMSKGKVQAEELRGQIGERIPGAFAIAARAMNMTQAQLNKTMDDGKLMAVDFLPRFAAELERTFGSGLAKATQSFQSQSNLREKALLNEEVAIGKKLQPAYLSLQDAQIKIVKAGGALIDYYTNNKKAMDSLGVGIGVLTGAYYLYTTATRIAKAETLALTATMLTNPITLAALAIGAAAGGLYYYTQKANDARAANTQYTDSLHQTKAEFHNEIEALKTLNSKSEEYALLRDKINSKYSEYLPNLITEKNSLQDIATAADAANKSMEQKILLSMREAKLKPIMDMLVSAQSSLSQSKVNASLLNAQINTKGPQNIYKTAANQTKLDTENNKIAALEKSIGIYQKGLKYGEKELDKLFTDAGFNMGSLVKKQGGKTTNNTTGSIAAENISSSKSIRNVTVTIQKLAEMTNHFNGPNDTYTPQNIKQLFTQLLLAVVNDSERALG